MDVSFGKRYLTATRYALIEQARNRLAFLLLIAFVPIWYVIMASLFDDSLVAFHLRATHAILQVDGYKLTLLTAGFNALTMIVGFMIFAAARKGMAFDHRLVLSGYPQATLILATKLTALLAVAATVAIYTCAILAIFWQFERLWLVCIGFFCAALAYGALGLLLGVLLPGELEGFFLIIMIGLLDTFLQNPIGNPAANKAFIAYFPSFGAMQTAVAAAYSDIFPWRSILLGLGWSVGFAILGLAVFVWRTRARHIHASGQPQVALPSPVLPPHSTIGA